jgi:hypothetical protein
VRYTKEVQFKFVGPAEKCAAYISEARKILGMLENQDRQLGGLDLAWRKVVLPDGAVILAHANNTLPQLVIIAPPQYLKKEEQRLKVILQTTWQPEGILLTPKTQDAPDGWGLPRRDPITALPLEGRGTLGGALPQVLLNKYPNNRYFDEPKFLAGDVKVLENVGLLDNPRKRESYETEITDDLVYRAPWIIHEQPWSYTWPQVPGGDYYVQTVQLQDPDVTLGTPQPSGVYMGKYEYAIGSYQVQQLVVPQTSLDEPKDAEGKWYAHVAEELLYPSLTHEGIFQRTNEVRVEVGEERLYRQLRGEGDSAYISTKVIATDPAESFTHSHPDFAPGYKTAAGRVENATGFVLGGETADNPVENLLAYSGGNPENSLGSFDLGVELANRWVASPFHYAGMINSAWTENIQWPVHSWEPQGTRGASLIVNYYSGATFTSIWDKELSDVDTYIVDDIDEINGLTVWAQHFHARESWLPVYDRVVHYELGMIGLFCGLNPHNRDCSYDEPRIGFNRTIYTMPREMYDPRPEREKKRDFLCIAGGAPFLRGEEGAEQIWLRVAYWESSERLDEQPTPGDEYLTLKVVVFPAALTEAGHMPWRPNDPPVWQEEYSRTFRHIDGYLPIPEPLVHFDSKGGDFVFEVEQIHDWVTHAVMPPYNRLDINPSSARALNYPAASVKRKAYRYDHKAKALVTLLPNQQPLEVTVFSKTKTGAEAENAYFLHTYEQKLEGQYKIWPHYDKSDNIQFVTLDIDEYSIQEGDRGTRSRNSYLDPAMNPGAPRHEQYDHNPYINYFGWRIRKMIFPSGKEFIYMQQYMWQDASIKFTSDTRFTPQWDMYPGTGENFYVVFHTLDVPNETFIYSKHESVDVGEQDSFSTDTEYYTTGEVTYFVDAEVGGGHIVQELAYYPAPDPELISPYMGNGVWDYSVQREYPIWLRNTTFFHQSCEISHIYDLYDFICTPYAAKYITTFTELSWNDFRPPKPPSDIEYTAAQRLVIGNSAPQRSGGNRGGLNSLPASNFFNSLPVTNYTASCFAGWDYIGESSSSIAWTERCLQGRTAYCGFWRNISPMFSKSYVLFGSEIPEGATEEELIYKPEVEAKFVEYDGRWVVRLRINHINSAGWRMPDPISVAWVSAEGPPEGVYSGSNYTLRDPSDGIVSWEGRDDLTKGAVHILANFDLEEALAVTNLMDINPLGRV